MNISVVNASVSTGVGTTGAEFGPMILETLGLQDALTTIGHSVNNLDQIEYGPFFNSAKKQSLRKLYSNDYQNRQVHEQTYQALKSNDFPLLIGGDHSMAIGSISAIAKHCKEIDRKLAVIWFDAHADINTHNTSITGNIHGIPLSVLHGVKPDNAYDYVSDYLQHGSVHQIGIRDVDAAEWDEIARHGVTVYPAVSVQVLGISDIVNQILATIGPDAWVHLSFDIDCIDPQYAPGVSTKADNGLTPTDTLIAMGLLRGKIHSMDMVELNTMNDSVDDKTAQLAIDLIKTVLDTKAQ